MGVDFFLNPPKDDGCPAKPTLPEFQPWPKIYRWSREWIITEKIDGTNAAVIVMDDGRVFAQSRNRLITPEQDNYGFAKWVEANKEELKLLGPGHHFGEWWGSGVQRGYGLTEKRFSIFNPYAKLLTKPGLPFGAVPILFEVPDKGLIGDAIEATMLRLQRAGSVASPGFMDPEGIVIFHVPSRTMFKKTCKNDEKGKEQ